MLKKLYWFLFVYDLNGSPACLHGTAGEPWKKKLMRDLTGLILFCYTLLIFNPVMPLVADVFAHTFWLKEHLMTEHKLLGNNHVHQQMVNAAHQSDKNQGSSKIGSEDYVHLITNIVFNFSNNYFITTPYTSHAFYYHSSNKVIDYPPPRA